jgi:hypothetical protein
VTARAAGVPRWALIVAGVVAAFVVLALVLRSDGQPHGPRSSSYATSAEGAAAYAALLERTGHRVRRLRAPLDEEAPGPASSVVALDPGTFASSELDALDRFVRAGGRLVVAGAGSARVAAAIGVDGLRDGDGGGRRAARLRPVLALPETAGVATVAGLGERTYPDAGSALPFLADRRGRTAGALFTAGRGQLVLLADSSPLRNQRLAEADNALLGVRLAGAGGRPVAFVESVHGYAPVDGLAAIPGDWQAAIGLAALAACLWLLTRVRRLGPPERAARELPPPRVAYVDALAATLRRTRDADAAAPVHAAVRRIVLVRGHLSEPVDADEITAAARALGLDDAEAAAVAAPSAAAADPLALGRALARLHHDIPGAPS